jgi:hypothetical protein
MVKTYEIEQSASMGLSLSSGFRDLVEVGFRVKILRLKVKSDNRGNSIGTVESKFAKRPKSWVQQVAAIKGK